MALPTNKGDREYQKFTVDADGNPAVRNHGSVTLRDTSDNQASLKDQDGTYRMMVSDPVAANLLENIYSLLLKLKTKIDNIM